MPNSIRTRTCPEHTELETKIAQCLQSLSDISDRAANLAKKPNYESSELFRMLLAENALAAARLRALRECLEVHRHAHGCCSRGPQALGAGEWAEEARAS